MDPRRSSTTQAERIDAPRPGGRLTLLDDGRLVFAGGRDATGQPSAKVDIFEFDSKQWRLAGTLRHPIASPGVLSLGDQRLMIFEPSGGGPVGTAELWDEASDSTQPILLPSDFNVSDAQPAKQDTHVPGSLSSQYASQSGRIDPWRAIGLSANKILLVSQGRSYLSESPYERWKTIRNDVEFWTVSSRMEALQNGNVLAFTGTPLPEDRRFCERSCMDITYRGQYEIVEFDLGEEQWHSLFAVAAPKPTAAENREAWPANLTRSDGPFYFLVVPHHEIGLKVYNSYMHLWETLLVAGLIFVVIY